MRLGVHVVVVSLLCRIVTSLLMVSTTIDTIYFWNALWVPCLEQVAIRLLNVTPYCFPYVKPHFMRCHLFYFFITHLKGISWEWVWSGRRGYGKVRKGWELHIHSRACYFGSKSLPPNGSKIECEITLLFCYVVIDGTRRMNYFPIADTVKGVCQ